MLKPGTYRYGVECGLQRAVGAVAALFAASWSMLLVSSVHRLAPAVLVVVAAFVVLAVLVAVRGARVRLGRADVLAAAVVAIAGHTVIAVERASLIAVGQRCALTVPAVLLAIGSLPRRAARAVTLLLIGVQLAGSWPLDGPAAAVQGIWPVAAAAVAGEVLGPLMRTAGARADRSEELASSAHAAVARAQARREAHRHFQDLLHDEVSSALRAVSLPGIAVAQVRQASRSAVAAMVGTPAAPEEDALADLAVLAGALGAPGCPPLTIEVCGASLVPVEVAAATMAAAAEALRNVAAHARARAVQVQLSGQAGGFVLCVTDDGVGFSPSRLKSSSLGLRKSVIRRMSDVGGTAEVFCAPGGGTTVRLAWQAAQPDATRPEAAASPPGRLVSMRAAIGDVRRPLAAVCLPYLLVMGAVAGVHAVRTPGLGWLVAWYVLLALLTVALLTRAGAPIAGPVAGAACAFAVAGAVGSFLVIPTSGIADDTSWPIGAVTPLLTLLVIVRPPWEALLALALEQVGIVLMLLAGPPIAASWGEAVAKVLPALFAPALGVVAGLALGRTVARLGAAVMDANARHQLVVAAQSARQARETLHRRRLADLDEEILPFLSRVASGEHRTQAPEMRARARALELAARDELHIPGVLDRATRDLLSTARAAGCVVTIQADADDPHPPELIRLMLTAALGTGSAPQELILSLAPVPDGIQVGLVTLPGDRQRAAALRTALARNRAAIEDTPESTWAEVSARTS